MSKCRSASLLPVRLIQLGLSLLMLVSAHCAFAEIETSESGTSPAETEAHVKVTRLREGTLPVTLNALGKVNASRQTPATIMALTAGVVNKISVRDGMPVSAGTVLLRFDARAAQAELRKAQSDLALAEKELSYSEKNGLGQQQSELNLAATQARMRAMQARQENERMAKLLAKALVSEKVATEARQAAETSRQESEAAEQKAAAFRQSGRGLEVERFRAKVEEARTALRLVEIETEAMTMRAPLAGRVTRVHVAIGQTVEKGTLLVELAADQGTGVSFALAPNQAGRIRPSMRFTLADEQTTRTYQGAIIAVGGGVDTETGLVRIEGILDGGKGSAPYLGEVLPGEITIADSAKGFIVPLSALSMTDDGACLHRVDEKHQAHLVTTQVLAKTSREAVVSAPGLKAGQPVITDGNDNLPEGAVVVAEAGL